MVRGRLLNELRSSALVFVTQKLVHMYSKFELIVETSTPFSLSLVSFTVFAFNSALAYLIFNLKTENLFRVRIS